MKRVLMAMVGIVAMLMAANGALQAQASAAQDEKTKPMQLTGCLAKGADANTFVLNNATMATAATTTAPKEETPAGAKAAMKTYHLTPKDTVKLDGHVGHRIEVTVEPAPAGAAKPATTGTTGKTEAMQHVTVTAMKHIAPKCE